MPGSHKRGEWPHDERTLIPDEEVKDPGVTLCARAGDVAIVHVLVVHRAGRNDSAQNRSCIINEYKTHEAVDCWGNRCAFADLPLRRNGRPFPSPARRSDPARLTQYPNTEYRAQGPTSASAPHPWPGPALEGSSIPSTDSVMSPITCVVAVRSTTLPRSRSNR